MLAAFANTSACFVILCCVQFNEGQFPSLIRAIHESDVSQHRHPQVLLVYFELSHRYIRFLDRAAILRLFQCLLGPKGVHSSDSFVRGRAAYFLLKVAETQEGKNANAVDAVYPLLTGKLIHVFYTFVSTVYTFVVVVVYK